MNGLLKVTRTLGASVVGVMVCASVVNAETINQALKLAYTNNPTLNAQRAATRAADEGVPIAKSGMRPFINGVGAMGSSYTRTRTPLGNSDDSLNPYSFGISVSQKLWDSFATYNNVNAAKALVFASRETLRNTEQNVLFDAASAYMNVIRDQQIAGYRKKSLAFLDELVRSEQARFDVGESTRTDVAQAQARQAQARASLSVAIGNLESSKGIYRQIIGKQPENLKTPKGVSGKYPKTLDRSLKVALSGHPALKATQHLVDQASFNVKAAESSLLPSVTLDGRLNRGYDQGNSVYRRDSSEITANLKVPIYQGGSAAGNVRLKKEQLGEARIRVDESVDSIRAAVVSAYSQLEAARASLSANREQQKAAQLALESVLEERNVGQRTTLDVLDTQQDVIDAQVAVSQAHRELIVAGYAALSASGKLSAQQLGLSVAGYNPVEHYDQVEDKWFGLRTPDAQR